MTHRWLSKGLVETLTEVREYMLALSNHEAFADDAPEFNRGGNGYIACTLLKRWLQAFEKHPEIREAMIELENKFRDQFAEAGTQVDWGTEVTPIEEWIDPDKKWRTRSGKRVVNIEINLFNDKGDEYTFPVKGTIIRKEKPLVVDYGIWTIDGRHLASGESPLDLVPDER